MRKSDVVMRGILFLGAIVISRSAYAQVDSREQLKALEVPLTDQLPIPKDVDQRLQSLQVSLLIEQHQSKESPGLRAIAVFRNNGSENVSLLALKDASILEVQTSDGWPVKPPLHVPDFFIHTTTRTLPSVIQIPRGEEYRIPIEIDRVFPFLREPQKHADSAAGSSVRSLIPLPAGEYQVKLRVLLIPDSNPATHPRALISRLVDTTVGE